MSPHHHRHHSHHRNRGLGRTSVIYPSFVDSETEVIVVNAEDQKNPDAVNGFFDFITEPVRKLTTPQFRPAFLGGTASNLSRSVQQFASSRTPQASRQARVAAYNLARRAHRTPGVRVAPYFGVNGEFSGYVAKDSVSGVEIGCCMVAGDRVEVSGFFDIITAPFKAVAKAATGVAKGVADVATSVNDRALKPVGKFVVKNAGTIAAVGAAALSVAFPPAGAVALAALAAQGTAKVARALGATGGVLGTITDIVDTAGGVITLNPQKIAEGAGRVGGMIGKVVHSQALIDAGATVQDVAAASRGDQAAIAKVTAVANKMAGKVTGMKEFADAGKIITEGARAVKGDPAAIASLTGKAAAATGIKAFKVVSDAGKILQEGSHALRGDVTAITSLTAKAASATGIKELQAIADTITVASGMIKNGQIVPGKLASEALRLASPQTYALLQKIDPRLLTNEGIKRLADLAKNANPAEAAKLAASVTAKYQADAVSSVNQLINNARNPNLAIRAAAQAAIENTRRMAARGSQDAQRAAAMMASVNRLQAVKQNVTRKIPAIPSAPNGGSAIFIARNGTTSRGRFVRDPRGQPGVLVNNGQRYAGTWKAV